MPDAPERGAKVSVHGTAPGVIDTPIRAQQLVRRDGVRHHRSVFCERRASSVALDQCMSCNRFVGHAGDAGGTPVTLTRRMHDGPAPQGHATTLLAGAAVGARVVCADPEVMLVEVRLVATAGLDVIPIVSAQATSSGSCG